MNHAQKQSHGTALTACTVSQWRHPKWDSCISSLRPTGKANWGCWRAQQPAIKHSERFNSYTTAVSNRSTCTVHHANKFVSFSTSVVYSVPFSCGHKNRQVPQHQAEGAFEFHKRDCTHAPHDAYETASHMISADPSLKKIAALYKHKGQTTREVVEAYQINKKGAGRASHASIAFHDTQVVFWKQFNTWQIFWRV